MNPPSVGETTLTFDPGLAVPANSGISARSNGSVQAEIYVEGYSVPSSQVPATAVSAARANAQQQQQQR